MWLWTIMLLIVKIKASKITITDQQAFSLLQPSHGEVPLTPAGCFGLLNHQNITIIIKQDCSNNIAYILFGLGGEACCKVKVKGEKQRKITCVIHKPVLCSSSVCQLWFTDMMWLDNQLIKHYQLKKSTFIRLKLWLSGISANGYWQDKVSYACWTPSFKGCMKCSGCISQCPG